jgi:hypothetical protein
VERVFGRVDDSVEADGRVADGGGGADDEQVGQRQGLGAEQGLQRW